ncbi:cis-prenyltransferase, partial [Tulasnella sp. 418]
FKEITEHDIDANLLTNLKGSPPLDILIRTTLIFANNGKSDFMLWQASENVQVHFTDTYCPDFGLRDFVPILLSYQTKALRRTSSSSSVDVDRVSLGVVKGRS